MDKPLPTNSPIQGLALVAAVLITAGVALNCCAQTVEAVPAANVQSAFDASIEADMIGGSTHACGICDYDECCSCARGCGLFPALNCDPLGRNRRYYDHETRRSLADKHVPAGLMGDHVHGRGEMMIEYKYMNMYMDGNKLGTHSLSDVQAIAIGRNAFGTNNAASPTEMTMEMHMIHIMYGLTDNVTIYAMPRILSLTMDHIRGPGNPAVTSGRVPLFSTFTTHNSGFGDTVFGALWQTYEGNTDELILNLSFSVPTGELDRESSAPVAGLASLELPYPMRLGSGTFNFRPGITYKSYYDHGSMGLQFQTDLPAGKNDRGYSVGDEFRLNWWYSWLMCDRLALSYRVEHLWRGNFSGADPDLVPAQISTARPDMRGGQWLNFGYGAMLLVGNGHLFNFEAVHPVYEHLDGIQLSNNWWFNASWSKAW